MSYTQKVLTKNFGLHTCKKLFELTMNCSMRQVFIKFILTCLQTVSSHLNRHIYKCAFIYFVNHFFRLYKRYNGHIIYELLNQNIIHVFINYILRRSNLSSTTQECLIALVLNLDILAHTQTKHLELFAIIFKPLLRGILFFQRGLLS